MKRLPGILLVIVVAITGSAQWSQPQPGDVPAYNAAAPPKATRLAPILAGAQLGGPAFRYPFQVRAYQLAAKTSGVIYQQPCYCFCDRNFGHNSLRSCFESEHGANCSVCMQEVFYAYKMTRKGKTAAQIRQGILRGDWKSIDLQKAASF